MTEITKFAALVAGSILLVLGAGLLALIQQGRVLSPHSPDAQTVPCRACGRVVARDASSCPGCGARSPAVSATGQQAAIAIVVVLAGLAAVWLILFR